MPAPLDSRSCPCLRRGDVLSKGQALRGNGFATSASLGWAKGLTIRVGQRMNSVTAFWKPEGLSPITSVSRSARWSQGRCSGIARSVILSAVSTCFAGAMSLAPPRTRSVGALQGFLFFLYSLRRTLFVLSGSLPMRRHPVAGCGAPVLRRTSRSSCRWAVLWRLCGECCRAPAAGRGGRVVH